VLVVIGYDHGGDMKAAVCGPVGEHPPFISGLDLSQVERLADAALAEPTRHAAVRFLVAMIPEAESDLPGLRNAGLLAAQELRNGVPRRADWDAACVAGKNMLGLSGRSLIERLGFKVDSLSVRSNVLTIAGGSKRAVAVFLEEGETFEEVSEGFNGTTAVSHALAVADNENLPWVVLTRGREIRLYAARPDTGVGRKGRSETFVEVNLALLPDQAAGYVPLLFGSDALREGGTVEQILSDSEIFAADLATRLRQRVYFEAVPALATAIARRMGDPYDLSDEDLGFAYEQTLVVLFRLLFVAYGEDRDLLPYRTNSKYQTHSLKQIARHLADDRVKGTVEFEAHTEDHWEDVTQLWRGVDKGNRAWGLPAYNGGLFSSDPAVNRAGAALADIRLTDAEFGPALSSLLVDVGQDDVIGPVDFRSLSVREFGTIYEGLLESMLSVAQTDLALDAKDNYVPAATSDTVEVHQGEVYFHNRSGERKATGSYFTKPFAVEHLLDHALEPALDAHLVRVKQHLEGGDDAKAAEAFFDFRCVDLAMGSGHFLVAAVDRIEARLANFLALNPIPAVNQELALLREAAREHLGDLADGTEIESTSLLRRQVARRCVYGVDRNRIAVELARLAIWIHTFVPGLPLSFLDHSLRQGDSLVGLGTVQEALDYLDPAGAGAGPSILSGAVEDFLDTAAESLRRLGRVVERGPADIIEARRLHEEGLAAVEPVRGLFDHIVAARLGAVARPEMSIGTDPALGLREPLKRGLAAKIGEAVGSMQPVHFPIAFPEVFVRSDPGFDCIIGNPPWEEATVEELGYWALRYPGLKSLPSREQKETIKRLRHERQDLVAEYESEVLDMQRLKRMLFAGPYPGMSKGDPDLYKAFCWRFWSLARSGGTVGVVLPRSALMSAGSSEWREEVLGAGRFSDIALLLNNGGWVFDEVHQQYTVALVAIEKQVPPDPAVVAIRGPFSGIERYRDGMARPPALIEVNALREWSEGCAFPAISSEEGLRVFLKMKAHPPLGSDVGWRARPLREFHATDDRRRFEFDPPNTSDLWPVYKGSSFNLWQPDTGTYFAWGDPLQLLPHLQDKRLRQVGNRRSAFHEMSLDWAEARETLPCLAPRIAVRDVTNRTNQRTVIASLVPPRTFLTNQACYLLWPDGDEIDQAFLLGVLSSIPLDWCARSVVETHVNFHLLNTFPVPRLNRNSELHRLVTTTVARLVGADERFDEWTGKVDPSAVPAESEGDRADLIALLDAAVGRAYGLSQQDLRVVFETFHSGWNHAERLDRVLSHYRSIG
jgi:hypothetical protein